MSKASRLKNRYKRKIRKKKKMDKKEMDAKTKSYPAKILEDGAGGKDGATIT